MKHYIFSFRFSFPLLILLIFHVDLLLSQKPVENFSVREIKINGKVIHNSHQDALKNQTPDIDTLELVYLYNISSDIHVAHDTLMHDWITDSLFFRLAKRSTKYWMGLKVEITDALLSHVLYFPVPNPYVTEVWLNNKLIYDLNQLKKGGLDWMSIQNVIPVPLNKRSNLLYFRVSHDNSASIFLADGGDNFKTHLEFITKINKRTNFTSLIAGLAVFYTTVTLLYFLLYFLGIRESKYLWGALFTVCCGSSLFLFRQMVNGSGVFSPALVISFASILLLTPVSFLFFIGSFFDTSVPKKMKRFFQLSFLVLVLYILMNFIIGESTLLDITGFISVLLISISLLLSVFYPVRFLFLAIRQTKSNARIILVGMIMPVLMLLLGLLVNSDSGSGFIASEYSILFSILPLPMSILISLVRDYSATNRNLTRQLMKVEELTATALREQQEKQEILSNQNEMLESQVEDRTRELTEQKKMLEERNHEILDSINYAKRIQQAILPPLRSLRQLLPDSFVLYQPKDIVAGDFYWLQNKRDKIFFAAADCTGHGVPGAMVSVVCNNALNRSVNEFALDNPADILYKTREIVIDEFEKSDEDVKDGMDISFCVLHGRTLNWCGANNPLWLIRKDAAEVEEWKPDKQPIGKFAGLSPFTAHRIDLSPGDQFYIFSDGYQDQFGGPKGKKFKASQLKQVLLQVRDLPMEQQRDRLKAVFEEWKGNTEQVDDVCVMGVRV